MSRYEPWLLRDGDAGPWGIKDSHTGVNVLGHFLDEVTGQVWVETREEADQLVLRGRMWEFNQQLGRLVSLTKPG